MYSLVSKGDHAPPTDYELKRLRKAETTAVLNNLIMEASDMLADFAFILVLFDQSVSISLPSTWYNFAHECHLPGGTTTLQDTKDQIFQIAVAATVFFVINVVYRALVAVFQVSSNAYRIKGPVGFLLCLVGIVATVVDPWSGAVLIEHQFKPEYLDKEYDDYRLTRKEYYSNWILIVLQDIPQFILQVVYASVIASSQSVGLSAAWFVALVTTVLHFGSQLHEVLLLRATLPALAKLAATSKHTVLSNAGAPVTAGSA